MVQRGEESRFAFKARLPIGVGQHAWRQHLEGDVPTEAGVACAIDLAHSAGAEPRVHLIVAKSLSDHGIVRILRWPTTTSCVFCTRSLRRTGALVGNPSTRRSR